jgi:monoamine oxidase
MNRRILLKQLMMGLPAAAFLPSLFSSCSKEELIENFKFKGSVLVIGAGASGIYAAHLLRKYGAQVTHLEARAAIGGRMQATSFFSNLKVELGAEEIHGKRSILYDLAQYTIPESIVPLNGDDYYWLENQLRSEDYIKQSTSLEGAGATLFQILDSLGSYPGGEQSVTQYLTDKQLDSKFLEIANALIGNEYGSDNNRLGMLALKEAEAGYSSGINGYGLKNKSYTELFELAFPEDINEVKLNKPVEAIEYSGEKVNVITEGGETFTVDKVLITVPISILKNNSITFNPVLNNEKLNAIELIKMDIGIKVILQFNAPFWNGNTGSIIGGTKVPEYWVTGANKNDAANLITAFVMGEKAEYLASLSELQMVTELIQELSTLFPNENVQGKYSGFYIVKNWLQEPYIEGAYSYPSPGSEGKREILAAPVSNKLYFAGEATNYNGHLATVHGAMESGYRAVKEILEA